MSIGSIKTFLKLDLIKVILVLFLGVVSYFLGIEWCGGGPNFGGGPQLAVCYVHYNPLFWGPLFLNPLYGYDNSASLSILRLLFGLIYWYFISCLLIFTWNKIKHKQ